MMGSTENHSNKSDCLSCRLISSGGLLAAAAYVVYHSRHAHGRFGKLIYYSLSGSIGYLGCARLISLPPFSNIGASSYPADGVTKRH